MITTARRYSRVSHVQTKLNYFIETGQVMKRSPKQYELNKKFTPSASHSLQKALLILKSKHDSGVFQDSNGRALNVDKLTAKDLGVSSEKSLLIFKNLINIKKQTHKSIDKRLLLPILGTNESQIKDPFLVTADVIKLLARDEDPIRAEYLARMAGSSGTVAMNAVLQWHLERGNVDDALKSFNDRKKWNIPPNSHTYVILFDGLSKCHTWGKVPQGLSEKCIVHFNEFRARKDGCGIEHFNSLLSLLVKNFSKQQETAWAFFNELIPDPKNKLPALIADIQTFTIFLNGIKEYARNSSERILQSDSNANIKAAKLLEVQAKLVLTADLILTKVLHAATPPVPPSKEEVEENAQLLFDYRERARRMLIDIDPTFASVFVSCYINNWSGTGVDTRLGSHFSYVQQGLEYLKIWNPEMNVILEDTSVSKTIKQVTEKRIERVSSYFNEAPLAKSVQAQSLDEILPSKILPSVSQSTHNPLVVFPPPPLSKNKTRAVFSDKKKPLVDFARPTLAEVRAILSDKNYHSSRGKYGKKLPADSSASLSRKHSATNRFLLLLAIDGLVKLGKQQEFYRSMWHILNKWGGLQVDESRLSLFAILKDEDYPRFLSEAVQTDGVEKKHYKDVVDIMLVDNFIYKINENFHEKGASGSNLAVELVAALVSPQINVAGSLKPSYKTIDAVFSSLISDLKYYNDREYNLVKKSGADETPAKSITEKQLETFLKTLTKYMDVLLVHEGQKSKQDKYLLPNLYIESYNKIVERLYKTTWLQTENPLPYHKQIIKSGILFYRPRKYNDPAEKRIYSNILQSLEYVYSQLKDQTGLSKEDIKLYLSIRSLFKLNNGGDEPLGKIDSISKAIYRSIE